MASKQARQSVFCMCIYGVSEGLCALGLEGRMDRMEWKAVNSQLN